MPLIEKPLVLELKTLPSHLKYAYLGKDSTLLVIVSIALTLSEEEKLLLRILREHKITFRGFIIDITGIISLICIKS